nr:hypothetical protein CFP56_20190 [Quercus suber]
MHGSERKLPQKFGSNCIRECQSSLQLRHESPIGSLDLPSTLPPILGGFLIKAAESLSIPLLQRTSSSSSSVVLFLCLSLQPDPGDPVGVEKKFSAKGSRFCFF